MHYFKLFVNSTLLLTTPTLLLYPQIEAPTFRAGETKANLALKNDQILSYDAILDLLAAIEQDDLEAKYSPQDLDKIARFLAHLAKEGADPHNIFAQSVLEEDIEELLSDEESAFEYAIALNLKDDYVIAPAYVDNFGEIQLCKSWVAKKCHQIKKFAKKHKKALLIGAGVVVGVGVIAVAVVAVSGAAAAATAAGAAAAAAVSSNDHPSTHADPTPDIQAQSVLDTNLDAFRDQVQIDTLTDTNDSTIAEKARTLGSHFVHKAFDEIADIGAMVPKACTAAQGVANGRSPNELASRDANPTPIQNYEKVIAAGHQKIDQVFSTDQAGHYTPESKARDIHNQFAIGEIPLPWGIFKAVDIPKIRASLQSGQRTTEIAADLGFSSQEIAELERTGSLHQTVTTAFESSAKAAEVIQLENTISQWLGEGTQVMRNKAGDPVFLSKDGLRKVRFDFNKPAPHESPHLHLEHLVDGEWQEISRVYPIDVPHQ